MQSDVTTPVNIGNPDEYTILEIAKSVALACGAEVQKTTFLPLPPSDPETETP